ncbi:hypothetical protein IAU60_002559 [Kwoniella sp. DSM 27419]
MLLSSLVHALIAATVAIASPVIIQDTTTTPDVLARAPRPVYRQATRTEVVDRALHKPVARGVPSPTPLTCSAAYDPTSIVFATFSNADMNSPQSAINFAGSTIQECEAGCQNLGAECTSVLGFFGGCYYVTQLTSVTPGSYTFGVRGYSCDQAVAAFVPAGTTAPSCTNYYCK